MEKMKQIFLKILSIIEYSGNREEHAEKFLTICIEEACMDVLEKMPRDRKDTLKARFSESTGSPELDFEKKASILLEFIDENEYNKVLWSVFVRMLQKYLLDVVSSLSQGRKESLQFYLLGEDLKINLK